MRWVGGGTVLILMMSCLHCWSEPFTTHSLHLQMNTKETSRCLPCHKREGNSFLDRTLSWTDQLLCYTLTATWNSFTWTLHSGPSGSKHNSISLNTMTFKKSQKHFTEHNDISENAFHKTQYLCFVKCVLTPMDTYPITWFRHCNLIIIVTVTSVIIARGVCPHILYSFIKHDLVHLKQKWWWHNF